MNKKYLMIAGVAVVALVAFGIMTQEQGDNADNMLTNMSASIEEGMDSTVEATEEMAADAEATADEAYQAAVEEMKDAKDAIEPAAGEAEETMEEEVQN